MLIVLIISLTVSLYIFLYFKREVKLLGKTKTMKVNLCTWKLNPDGSMIDADDNGKRIPIILQENFNLQIPIYLNKSPHHEQPFIEYNGRLWMLSNVAQLKTHVNLFVLDCGSADPKSSPLCIVK